MWGKRAFLTGSIFPPFKEFDGKGRNILREPVKSAAERYVPRTVLLVTARHLLTYEFQY